MLPEKDPAEIITVTFDFADLATTISAPAITCVGVSGKVDDNASAMLSGSPQISGLTVMQSVIGGIAGNVYKLRCQIDDADGERWVVADTLTVETA